MITILTITKLRETHTYRYFGFDGHKLALDTAESCKRRGWTVKLEENAL